MKRLLRLVTDPFLRPTSSLLASLGSTARVRDSVFPSHPFLEIDSPAAPAEVDFHPNLDPLTSGFRLKLFSRNRSSDSSDNDNGDQPRRHILIRTSTFFGRLFLKLFLTLLLLNLFLKLMHKLRVFHGSTITFEHADDSEEEFLAKQQTRRADRRYFTRICQGIDSSFRLSYCLYLFLSSLARYKYVKYQCRHLSEDDPERKRRYDEFHSWCAHRILKKLTSLGGIFIKAGQEFSMAPMFPSPIYNDVLSVLHDHVDCSIAWKDVKRLVEADTGRSIDEVFIIETDSDKNPVASASLASVYKWKLRSTGETVAVKIQYPTAMYYVDGDVLAQKLSMKFGTLFDDTFKEMYDLMEDNFDLFRRELDFVHEAKNQIKCRNMFLDDPVIFAPKVYEDLSGQRVLTMEWVDGIKPTLVEEVKNQYGYGVKQVARSIFRAYAAMVFSHGFVHGDLHPGNMFVCQGGGSDGKKMRLCILDHGLYATYKNEFRLEYARLWKALVLNDEDYILDFCERRGIKNHKLFVTMITWQSYDAVMTDDMMGSGEFTLPKEWIQDFERWDDMSADEKKEVEESWKPGGENYEDWVNFGNHFPAELLFVMRSMFILGFVNSKLGAPINRFNLMARTAVRELGKASSVMPWWETMSFEAHLAWNTLKAWVLVKLLGAFMWFASFTKKDGEEPSEMQLQMKGQMDAFKKRMQM